MILIDTINHKILLKKRVTVFSHQCVRSLWLYLCEWQSFTEIETQHSDYWKILFNVPKGSAGRGLMFLIHTKFIWGPDIEEIGKIVNKDFENDSKWVSENKLSIHYGENKTKSILYATKCKIKSAENNKEIRNNKDNEDIRIKQRTHVSIFWPCVARNMFLES